MKRSVIELYVTHSSGGQSANAASARRNEVQSSCALPYLKAHSAKSLIKPETYLKHKSNLFSPEKYNLKITTNLHISVLKSLLKN